MRLLRLFTNAIAASLLATAYVLTLVLELNPAIPLASSTVMPIATTVGLYYAIHLTAIFYLVLVLRQLFARDLFSPAWVSVGVLVALGGVTAAAGAVLFWKNLTTFALVLDPATASILSRSAMMLAVCAGALALLAWFRRQAPDARWTWATLLGLVMLASVAGPLALRGSGMPAEPAESPAPEAAIVAAADSEATALAERVSHVYVVALDAGSLDFITAVTAEGRLPNFGKLLDGGAVRHLATLRPTSAEAVWAAVATGKLPQKNGVRSAGIYQVAGGGSIQLLPEYCFANGLVRLGFLIAQAHSSATFRTRTVWSILSMHGISVGVVGWPLTQPAPPVRGFVVADGYHRVAVTPSGIDEPSALFPPELQLQAAAAMEQASADTAPVLPASFRVGPRQETPARTDRIYDAIAQALAVSRPAQVTLTRFQSLDPVGHYFLRFAAPAEFGDVTDEERRRLGGILEQHYAFLDEAIGRAIARLGPDDLLLVVSGFGMEPLTPEKRLLERMIGDPDLNGTHDTAPDGFLIAYGGAVAKGRTPTPASVVDVVPTMLYFLGLPIGRDMDGFARTDIFRSEFTEDRPITYIPTYDR